MHLTGSPVVVVSVLDDALDVVSMGGDLQAYRSERDPDLIREKPGNTLTRFYVGRMRASVLEGYVAQAANDYESFIRAFRVGIAKVTHLVDIMGITHETVEPSSSFHLGGTEVRCFSDEQMELIAPVYKQEIGQAAWSMSFFGRATKPYFHQPPSLLLALADRISRDAEEIPDDASVPSSGKQADSPVRKSGVDGGKGTGVDAKTRKTRHRESSETNTRVESSGRSSASQAGNRKRAHGRRTKRPRSSTS